MSKNEFLNWNFIFHTVRESEIGLRGKIGFSFGLDFDIEPKKREFIIRKLGQYGIIKTQEGFSDVELNITNPVKYRRFENDALEGKLNLDGLECASHISPHPVRLGYEMGLNEWY
ncbi:MAG: hypothetical protein KAT43_03830 [Nanoarchaeota archaeon]|nr:hypothetical protein [Nanoarchaeota archaeon]